MSQADDLAYFSRRFAEEMARGDEADSASIAAVHYELAHRYSLIVRANPGKSALTLIGGNKPPPASDDLVRSEARRETSAN